ncbi:MAG TPA: hypothetical protein VGO23_08155 [Pseudonocardia sp.]|nr:hypothetical protein [Pseudonocardia sp.]
MLKKAGIVVAAAAASLLAVSPLAFAGEKAPEKGHHESSISGSDFYSKDGKGLVNVSGNNLNVPVQACNNDVPINGGVGAVQTPVKDLTGGLSGALGILGSAKSDTDVKADNSRACAQESGAGDTVGQ